MARPIFVLDGDDVLLRTGHKKVEYLRDHISDDDLLVDGQTVESIKPEECSRSLLVPLIGLGAYEQMATFVYSLEGTRAIPPVNGALQSVKELSRLGDIYVVSARSPEQTENTREWCRANEFMDYFVDVASTKALKYSQVPKVAGSKKVGIARHLGARLFVDDDLRHMPDKNVEGIDCVLFGEAERKNINLHIYVARTWSDVVTLTKGFLK